MLLSNSLYRSLCSVSNVEGLSELATRGVLCKKVFLEISQNSQENTCARVSFLIKLHLLRTPLLQNTSGRLFLAFFIFIFYMPSNGGYIAFFKNFYPQNHFIMTKM